MKLIDVIDQLRKEEKIPVQQFIDGIMSSHSYYRYVSHEYEMKLSQGLALMKKLSRSPESIFDYLSVVHQSPKAKLALFLQAKVNNHEHMIEKYQESLKSYVFNEIELKEKLTHFPQVESTYQYIYESLIVYDNITFSKKIVSLLDLNMMQKNKKNRYITGILSYLYFHGLYESTLHKMLKRITNPNYFISGSWDIPFLMSKHVLDKHVPIDYKKHFEIYEKHILWISKRLTGTLDIGFIEFCYKHLSYVYHIKEDKRFHEMLYRYIATIMLTHHQEQLQEEIKRLKTLYHMDINDFYETYTKKQIDEIIQKQ